MSTKDLDKPKGTDVSTDVMDDIFETAGEGATFDSSEMQIPFIRIIQNTSPHINKKQPEYIEGASMGDIYNTVTSQHWDGEKGINVVPCYQTTKYLEFTPRDQGGGFKGEISPTDPVLQRTERQGSSEILPNKNEVVRSDQTYCLVVDEDGSWQPAVIDMKSSQLKVGRRWKTMIAMQKVKHPKTGKMVTPAVFATVWKLNTTEESNDKGSWNNYAVERVGLVESKDLLQEAMTFRKAIAAGDVKAVPDPEHENKAVGGQGSSPDTSNDGDEIPF